jgi:DNA-binding transcriptional MerR regulator
MQVGEIAEKTGASVRSIRYYEQSGLLTSTRRPNGYREFPESTVERVRAIRDLIEAGFTVEEVLSVASCLHAIGVNANCCEQTEALYREKIAKIDHQVDMLLQLRGRIEDRIEELHQGRVASIADQP